MAVTLYKYQMGISIVLTLKLKAYFKEEIISQGFGILKPGLLLLEQMNTQSRIKYKYLIISQNSEYIIAL
jgi:hypothetical protein